MNYVEKEFSEIFESALTDSVEKGLISHADDFLDIIGNLEDISNYYVMDKAVISKLVADIYLDLTRIYESAKVEYAEGSDLDDIGRIVGVPRPQPSRASVYVNFSLNTSVDENISIPEGIILSTEDGIEYETVEELFLPADSTSVFVECQSREAGSQVKIVEDSLTIIVSNLDYDFSVSNPRSSSGGNDEYSDDEYRYLLMNWKLIMLKGSLEAFEEYFANCDGIDGYELIPNWDGTGTMKVIVDPGTPSQLNRIYDDLQNRVSQATEDIVMSAPVAKNIDIYATVNVDIDQINPYSAVEKDNIKSRVIQGIKIFIDGGFTNDGNYYPGLFIGEDFIPHKLAVFLDDEIAELKNIKFDYPEDYIVIDHEEIGVSNNIVIEMI